MSFVKHDQIEKHISDGEMQGLADRFLSSLRFKKWDLLRLILTRDCIWRWPGTNEHSGTAIGIDAVVKEIPELAERIVELKLTKILYGLNGVALSLHFRTIMIGKEEDEEIFTVCILRGYQIAGINNYLADNKETHVL